MNKQQNPFSKHKISVRVGQTVILPEDVNEESIVKATSEFNASKHLTFLSDTLNPECLDLEKVKALFSFLLNQNEDFYAHLKNRTLYLNNPEFRLGVTAPTNASSYTDKINVSFEFDNSILSLPGVDFGQNLVYSDDAILLAKKMYLEKSELLNQLEQKIELAEIKEDQKSLPEFYQKRIEEKYCLSAALRIWRDHLKVKLEKDGTEGNNSKEYQEVEMLFEKNIVPPLD